MSTIEDVLQTRKDSNVLQAPLNSVTTSTKEAVVSAQTNPTVNVALVNNTNSSNVFAYVSGLAIDNNNAPYLLKSDGSTPYYPASPSNTGAALSANCAIKLGAPGSTTKVTVPHTAGGRFWFSKGATLTFLLNPGPALVEPSVTNPSDPNYNLSWEFCEFAFNSNELFVNISYADFVCFSIALELENNSGAVSTVQGLPANCLDAVCDKLIAQTATDGADWSSLIVKNPSTGARLRALSPGDGISVNNSLFKGYYKSYIDAVWSKYTSSDLQVNTAFGTFPGRVNTSTSELNFSGVVSLPRPSEAEIFSCDGIFASGDDKAKAVEARVAAAFNRSTLLIDSVQPNNEVVSTYYKNKITNHYSRILHELFLDTKGYAFPYDDVRPDNGADQSGSVNDPNPKLLTIKVGGVSSTTSK
ncbi:Glucan endo-1,3-beta-glucosidase [Cytospora mali]|uniref:Glucan endo-1,3-beta-glucosidase n=1 Tax=Cytospora mali TaxID=578113 RepID=A0A194V5Q8_CYTMA|nr:Glucan endo-1,3-beta-glucosidase [Valsa mali var. pyri (nom. inval.)]